MKVGKPVSAVLFAMGRGPIMLYHGQEVGEPAAGAEGFGGDDARTTIFDYWSMPEFAKWVNGGKFDGGRLERGQLELRAWYGKLLHATRARAFTAGEFYGLNHANKDNPAFGRVGDETVSGHWLYAFLRRESKTGQAFLVVANFHGAETLRGVKIRIPHDAQCSSAAPATKPGRSPTASTPTGPAARPASVLENEGLALPELAPCTAMLLEIGR